MDKSKIGTIGWMDLTVEDAEGVSEFYKEVTGWDKQPLSMGEYDDYVMKSKGNGDGVAGICHARGKNNYLPAQWLLYTIVENIDACLEKCTAMGGKVIGEKRSMGEEAVYCLIQDPAGAYIMLYENL